MITIIITTTNLEKHLCNGRAITVSETHMGGGLGQPACPHPLKTPESHKTKIYKTTLLWTRQYQTICVIYPSGEISRRTWLMTGTLQF